MGCKDGTGCAKSDAAEPAPLPLTGWDVAAEFVGRAFEEIAERRLAWQAEVDRANKVKQELVDHATAFAMGALPAFIAHMGGESVKVPSTEARLSQAELTDALEKLVFAWRGVSAEATDRVREALKAEGYSRAGDAVKVLVALLRPDTPDEGRAEGESENEKAHGAGRTEHGPASPAAPKGAS